MSLLVMIFSIVYLTMLFLSWRKGTLKLKSGPMLDRTDTPVLFYVHTIFFAGLGFVLFFASAWMTVHFFMELYANWHTGKLH